MITVSQASGREGTRQGHILKIAATKCTLLRYNSASIAATQELLLNLLGSKRHNLKDDDTQSILPIRIRKARR